MIVALPLLLALLPQDDAADDWPTFEVRDIQGFEVHVNEADLAAHPDDMAAALAHLRWQLYATSLVLPAESLTKVREVPLWAEYETQTACMSFHPGRPWLLDHGYQPPDVPSVVEMANAKNFLAWTHHQPWMVLHELAHGLDFVHIGQRRRYGEPTFDALWNEVKETGRYEAVRHWGGGESRHYGLNNPMEHFAESTEAYFGINDFYPFVRAELREFDPVTTKAIEARWGVDVEARRAAEADLVEVLYVETPWRDEPAIPVLKEYVNILGWRVGLEPALAANQELARAVLAGVEHELHLVSRYLPTHAVADLQAVMLVKVFDDLEVIPYIDSLHGAGIVIGNAERFLAAKMMQPCIMIREIAGLWTTEKWLYERWPVTDTRLNEALERVSKAGLYDSVLRFDGRYVPHPALRNSRTFFAEMSEAYFLGNDHFPFVRAELMNHDPETFALMEKLWHPEEGEK